MGKHIGDESLVLAVLSSATLAEAAEKIGLKERTVRERLRSEDCQSIMKSFSDDAMKEASAKLQYGLSVAINVLVSTACDENVSRQVRVNSANLLLGYALKYSTTVELIERIEKLEKLANDSR